MKLFCSNINYKSVLRGVYVSLIRQQHRTTINLRATYDKLPSEQENNHAYGIVQKSLYRYDNAFQKSHDFQNVVVKYDNFDVLRLVNNESYVENLTLTEICHVFMIVTEMSKREERPVVSLEDPNVRILCIRVTKKIPEMKDDQMVNILKALTLWPPTPSTRTPNFKELWNSLDTQCVTRCQTWKNDQLLHVAHLWALLHLSRISLYNVSMIRKLCSHINELDISEVIQLLFFINLQREAPSRLVMTSIEEKLLTHIDTLTVQELSVAALGFFKTKFKMNNQQLLISIMQKLRSNLEHLDEPSLAALLKLLRYSMVPDLLTHYRQVQQALIPRIATCQPQTVIHIILLNSANLVCHHEALTQMIDRFIQDLKSLRLKDISRSLYCLSLFLPRHKMSQKYALQIAEELQSPNRQQEIVEYSVSFLSSVLYLAYMNIFPEKLINQCLTWDFIRILKENNYMEPLREAYVLDNSVGLECSDYVGARLSTTLKMTIFKQCHHVSNRNSHQSRMTSEIQSNLATILGGSQYCHVCHILPHFQQPDILILLNDNGKPQVISKMIEETPMGTIIHPQGDTKWLTIVVGGRSFYLRDCKIPSGISQMKLRQLKRLGYEIIEIPWFEYTTLSERQRKTYLRAKISISESSSKVV